MTIQSRRYNNKYDKFEAKKIKYLTKKRKNAKLSKEKDNE